MKDRPMIGHTLHHEGISAGGADLFADAAVQHCRRAERDDSSRPGRRAAGLEAL